MIPLQKAIRATVFGGKVDRRRPERSAYDGKVLGDGLYAALPWRFRVPPKIKVTNPKTGKSVVVQVRDVGPWGTRDPYWTQEGRRPEAESGRMKHGPNRGRRTNGAGIDLSEDAAKAIGITGDPRKDLVNWEEVHG